MADTGDPASAAIDARALLDVLDKCDLNRDHYQACLAAGLHQRMAALSAIDGNGALPTGAYVAVAHGGQMFVNLRDYVGRELFLHTVHEPRLSAWLVRQLRPGQVFIDVGAHFGYFSHLAATLVGDAGRVLAVEPTPSTLNYLRMNVKGLHPVEIIPSAAWRKYEVLTLQDYGAANSCLNTVLSLRWARDDLPPPPPVATVKVPGEPLDAVLEARNLRPHVIKIDVESAEQEVLEGLTRTIANHRPVLVFEAGDVEVALQGGARTSRELIEYVIGLGYCVHPIGPGGALAPPRQAAGFEGESYQNLVGLPVSGLAGAEEGGEPESTDAREGDK